MGVYYRATHTSEDGTNYVVDIEDGTLTSIKSYKLTRLEFEYEGDSKDRFHPVIASSLKMSILVNTKYAHMQDFFDDLVGAQEGRFIVKVYTNPGTLTLAWAGYILVDLASRPDLNRETSYEIQIQATDGLGRLRSIDYNNSGTAYTGYETVNNHLLNCLNKLSTVQSYTTSPILKVVANWWENSMTYSTSTNPLTQAQINHKNFVTIDRNGNTDYMSCYDVLESICRSHGARMIFSEQSFWFIQVNEYSSADNVTVFEYQKNGTESTSAGQSLEVTNIETNINTTDVKRLSGGAFTYLAPLRKVAIQYRTFDRTNLTAGASWTKAENTELTVEGVDSNGATAKFTWQLPYIINSEYKPVGAFQEHYFRFEFKIQIGTKYLKRTGTLSGGVPDYGSPEWTSTSSDVYVWYSPKRTSILAANGVGIPNIRTLFLGDDIPALPEDGDLVLDINLDDIVDTVGNSLLTPLAELDSYDWEFNSSQVEILAQGTYADQTQYKEYCSTNDTSGNSEAQTWKVIIGDGPTSNNPGALFVSPSAADGWRVGNSGTYKAFSQLLANEVIAGQLTPVEVMNTRLIHKNGYMFPHNFISYNGAKYVLLRATFNVARAEWDGEWFKLQSASGYSECTPIDRPGPGGEGGGGTADPVDDGGEAGGDSGGGGGGGSGGGGNTVRMIQETVTESGSATLPAVTKNNAELPNNEDQVMLFGYDPTLGGLVPIHPDEYTIDGPNGQITLTWTPRSGEKFLIVWFVIT